MFKTLKTSQIIPSQDYLKEGTVKFIVDCIEQGKTSELPPLPIVRPFGDYYIAIDGHNLIAVMEHMNRDVKVFVVSTKNDKLPGTDDATQARNIELDQKFDGLEASMLETQKKGIHNFKGLVDKYSNLFMAS